MEEKGRGKSVDGCMEERKWENEDNSWRRREKEGGITKLKTFSNFIK